ncbi:FtsW/RodA/SpoVE family cell cycle protein [Sporolactobacillus terrae]|uniref:Cell division protein n=1 Tax=Sporolactobacillus terrae TaxID=269673 RepID=A0A410D7X7_9BACL|nr:FtsW/RodA/SpoVE family cell cycle protein [Sporolactobacillus terrae]QAA22180.1 cell division protein [Sporolactobacillus terrae]QAA25153.1 cell division protein [Sporolactobacillus terrae]UAK16975.1 FtsW/RodA/SpoVE family cell cycle protein [Sporolactobacillus terrae]BBN98488.1 cell division protein FtsW [Sporolactobacillus terrae]
MLNRDSLAKIDYTLFFIVFLLACISYISISMAPLKSGAPAVGLAYRQVIWYVFSTMIAVAIMFFDYERLKRMHWIFYGIGMFLLIGLTFAQLGLPVPMVDKSHGATSWYALPGIGQLQPSEFMKLFMIVSIATTIDKHNEVYSIRGLREDLLLLGKIALVSLPPFFLVFIQPDLGTALVMFSIILSMTIVSGINWKLIVSILITLTAGLAFFAISWFHFPQIINIFLKSHQKDRFLAWQDPERYSSEQGYQLLQSIRSIGSGEFFNHQFNSAISLPESYNDFIFAVIGGGFGFVGAVTVILLFFLLISRVIKAGAETHDPFGSYICTGIIGMIMFQVFENIGMTIQVMPVTGITLPFLSYGGSSLLSSMICIGLVQSIRLQTQKFMFS